MYALPSHHCRILAHDFFFRAPSVFSLKKAMQSYARQGGTSAIFVHDDGMQLISEAERQARITFYANHNIGWIARPPHGQDAFVRPGRFKKASNMNYGLSLSVRLEKKIQFLEREGYTDRQGVSLEDQALDVVLEEIYQENGEKWRPWASNAKSLRVGEVILIIDSDTIVPEASSIGTLIVVEYTDLLNRIASVMLLANLPNVPRLLSFSMNLVCISSPSLPIVSILNPLFVQMSCKWRTTSSRMVSPTSLGESTDLSVWRLPTAKLLPSSVTMHFFDGLLSKMPHL